MSYHNLYSALPTVVLAACLIVPSADTVADPNLAGLGSNDNAHPGLTTVNGTVHSTSPTSGDTASRGGQSSDNPLNAPQPPTGHVSSPDGARPVGGLAAVDDRPYRTTDGPVPGADDPSVVGVTTNEARSPAGDNSDRDAANPVGGFAAVGAPYGTTEGTVSEGDGTPGAGMPSGSSRTPVGNNSVSNGASPAGGGLAAAGTPVGTIPGPKPGSDGSPVAGISRAPTGNNGGSHSANPPGGVAAAGRPAGVIPGPKPGSDGTPVAGISRTLTGNNGGSHGANPPGGVAAAGTPSGTTNGSTPRSDGTPGDGTPTGAPPTSTPTGNSGPDSVISPAVADIGPHTTVLLAAGQGGEPDAVLVLDPPSPTAVPEPGSWLMLTVGLAMIASLSRQRRRPD